MSKMISFEDFMEMMSSKEASKAAEDKPIPTRRQLQMLNDAKAYYEPVPFKVGDIVTTRAGAPVQGQGQPSLVIDVNPEASHQFKGSYGNFQYGCRPQIRVVRIIEGHAVPFWQEAAWYEPFTEAMIDLADAVPESKMGH